MKWIIEKLTRILGCLRRHGATRRPTGRPLIEVALEYCETHPEARASIIAAGRRLEERESENTTQGWDGARFVATDHPHKFSSAAPWGKCMNCGTLRENAVSVECPKYMPPHDIAKVIRDEAAKYAKVLKRAESMISHTHDYSGGEIFYLWQTHGISPDVVEAIQERTLPSATIAEFDAAMSENAERSRGAMKPREILIAKIARGES